MFDFLGDNFFDASVGESALEPIQLAVRSVIERAVLEMTSRLYRIARRLRRPVTDPLADGTEARAPASTGGSDRAPAPHPGHAIRHARASDHANNPTTARNEEHHNDNASRQAPYRFYGSGDPAGDTGLRGSE